MPRPIVVALLVTACWAAPAPAEPESGGRTEPRIDLSQLAPAQRFDFLLGDWTYEFPQGRGSTTYRRASAGGAIVEYLEPGFIALGGAGSEREFTGLSIFLHDPASGWRQNWIDTLGNVLQGTGGLAEYAESDLPAMITEFTTGGNKFRHVWYDVRKNRFETDLYVSTDGTTFQLIRRMPYVRKGS